MPKMTFMNADRRPPVPVEVDVPESLVDDYRDAVYIAWDPCARMDAYPDDGEE